MVKYTGTIEEIGMSIFMQGSHKLLDDKGEMLALLQTASEKLDLGSYVGKKVEVSGSASPSVEGSSTIVNVDSVRPL